MKKLILLLVIAISMITCSNPTEYITTDAFINDLNSFDSTARYAATSIQTKGFTFIISYNDSLFYYNVERSPVTIAIYTSKNPGDKVK